MGKAEASGYAVSSFDKGISSAQNPLCEGAGEHFGWIEIN